MSFGKHELMNRIGKEAEEEVCKKLSKIFGYRNVSFGVDGYSLGTEGYPDVQLIIGDKLFYIEVKSIIPFVKKKNKGGVYYRTNAIKLNKDSWNRLKNRAKAKIASILMIVEIRLLGDNDYFIINYDTLEDLVLASSANEWVHIPLNFILLKCKKLEFKEYEFVYNPIETPQIKIIGD
jgi:hypothetical protein